VKAKATASRLRIRRPRVASAGAWSPKVPFAFAVAFAFAFAFAFATGTSSRANDARALAQSVVTLPQIGSDSVAVREPPAKSRRRLPRSVQNSIRLDVRVVLGRRVAIGRP